MNSPSAGSRQTRSNRLAGAAGVVVLLFISFVGFKLLPWPRSISRGWIIAALMFGGGAIFNRLIDGAFMPDASRWRSIASFGAGALLVQFLIHVAACFGF